MTIQTHGTKVKETSLPPHPPPPRPSPPSPADHIQFIHPSSISFIHTWSIIQEKNLRKGSRAGAKSGEICTTVQDEGKGDKLGAVMENSPWERTGLEAKPPPQIGLILHGGLCRTAFLWLPRSLLQTETYTGGGEENKALLHPSDHRWPRGKKKKKRRKLQDREKGSGDRGHLSMIYLAFRAECERCF